MILGIDLGTTNSLGALFKAGKPEILKSSDQASGIIPSVVSYAEDGQVHAGKAALARLSSHAQSTVYSAKRFFGKTFVELEPALSRLSFKVSGDERSLFFNVGEKRVRPFEVSAEVLREVVRQSELAVGESIKQAVITVPAYFDDQQRNETRAAAKAAGLDVVRMINEPTAAALAYGLDLKREGNIAVYDLGGGTFDVSILQLRDGVFKVLSTNGDTFLGGDDFDDLIVSHILQSVGFSQAKANAQLLAALKIAAEAAKKKLSEQDSVHISLKIDDPLFEFEGTLNKTDFEAMIAAKVKKTLRSCKNALKDSGLSSSDISEVVLVGGSTRIPYVRQKVEEFFEQTPYVGLNPDEVVALGAAVQGAILEGEKREILLLDVVPLSLGIETLGGAVTKLLLRNTTIPVSVTEDFTTSVDNQTGIIIHVLQGERELVEDCRSLGKFSVTGLPPMPAGLPKLAVTFTIDANGMLRVEATEERSGKSAFVELAPSIGLSLEEMERVVEDSIEYAMDDFELRMIVETRNKAERILVALDRTIDRARNLMDAENMEKILSSAKKTRMLLDSRSKDKQSLEAAVEELGDLTRPLADLIFNDATREALVGKAVKDV